MSDVTDAIAPPPPGLTSTSHPMLASPSQANLAREEFCGGLKRVISRDMTPEMESVFERRRDEDPSAPEPRTRHEIAALLNDDPAQQMWSALRRISQELMIDGIAETVETELPSLIERSADFAARPVGGSLTVDPDLTIPGYIAGVDVHCMPTGYHQEVTDDDLAAGAMYDRLVFAYTLGELGPLNDSKGQTLIENYLKPTHPDLRPKRILDMGCSVGHSTLPYVDAYPDAEITAIDIGAPMVRYAHARAQALNKPVHFMQANAEATSFDDESFDLVVSHILLHESSRAAIPRIFAESLRLLRPGGLMVHADYSPFSALEPIAQYLLDWDTHYNNEPCWGGMRDLDLAAVAAEAGFPESSISRPVIPVGRRLQLGRRRGAGEFHLLAATKPA